MIRKEQVQVLARKYKVGGVLKDMAFIEEDNGEIVAHFRLKDDAIVSYRFFDEKSLLKGLEFMFMEWSKDPDARPPKYVTGLDTDDFKRIADRVKEVNQSIQDN